MSAYPSLHLQSHTVLQSHGSSFMELPKEDTWLNNCITKLKSKVSVLSFLNTQAPLEIPKGPIVCAAWHPMLKDQIAFGMNDGTVQVVIQPSSKPIPLKNKNQRELKCLAWQPNSPKTLTVGSSTGLLVWEVISQRSSNLPSRTTHLPTSAPVSSLSYSPDGRQLMVTSGTDLLVYNSVTGASPQVVRHIASHSFVLWSPSISYSLLVEDKKFSLLRGITAGSEPYVGLQSSVKCAVWAASHLLFSLHNSSYIFSLELYNMKELSGKVSPQTVVLVDVSMCAWSNEEDWIVEDMSLSEGGERLAVIVRNNDTARSQVALFSLSLSSGSVQEMDVIADHLNPVVVAYQLGCTNGALLCVCGDDGVVEFSEDNFNTSFNSR